MKMYERLEPRTLCSTNRPSRAALEALALEGYRRGILTQLQVGQLLYLSRIETEDFLAQHVDLYDYDSAELHREIEALADMPKTDKSR